MILMFKAIIVIMAFLIVFISVKTKQFPKGIIEWIFLMSAFIVVISDFYKIFYSIY